MFVRPDTYQNKTRSRNISDIYFSVKDYGAIGDGVVDDTTAINNAISVLPANGGRVFLPAGTYKVTASIVLTENQQLVGAGVGATVLTSSSDIVLIRMGNRQADGIMRNWMGLEHMTVNQTGGTQTHANVLIDGGGRGTMINNVSTGGGKYGFELMDLDRCDFRDISANNPGTAGIFLEVGLENTYGTVSFVNCDAVLSNSSTYGFLVDKNAGQVSPNAPDRLAFIGCMMFMSGGLTGCVGFYNKLQVTSTSFIGCLFEQNNRQYRSDGNNSVVNFHGCSFLDANNVCTDALYLTGSGSYTVYDCRFQQCTNCFNGVSNSPRVGIFGINTNQGNITNLFTGSFGAKHGTDTEFAGDAVLAMGINSQRIDYGFINHIVGNPVQLLPSSNSTTGIQFQQADGTLIGQVDTTNKLLIAPIADKSGQVYNVKAYGATGDGTTNDTTAIQAAITAASPAGTIYFPTGNYLVSSSLGIATGLRLQGESKKNTKITNNTGDVFTFAASASWWEVDHLTVIASAGHIFAGANNQSAFHVHHCSLQETANAKSIWNQSGGQIVEGYFTYCDLYMGGSAPTVPAFDLTDTAAGHNANVFEKCVCTTNVASTAYFFSLISQGSGNNSYGNTFRDMVFEQCVGGAIFAQSQFQLLLDNVQIWDGSVISASTADFIHIGKYSTANSSRGITIRKYSRQNSTLGGSLYDISFDGTTQQITIDSARAAPDNANINFNSAAPATVTNQSPGTTITNGTPAPSVFVGTAVPSTGAVWNARVGDMYVRQDGGAGTYIYRCSVAGNPGTWVATAA